MMERKRFLSRLKNFNRSERGAIGVTMAVAAPVIIGVAGLAVDYNVWQKEQTALKRITESAAIAAAYAKADGATDIEPYALADAEKNGFDSSRETMNVSFADGTITVDIERQSDRFLSSIITNDDVLISALAEVDLIEHTEETTQSSSSSGYACITALDSDPERNVGIHMHNTAYIEAENCGVHSNAVDTQQNAWTEEGSLYMRNAHIEADFVRAVGDAVVNDWNGDTTTSVEPESNAAPFIDPFAEMTPPAAGSCMNNGQTVNWVPSPTQLQPGTYCGDIIIQNGGKANFAPGVYNIVDGDLLVRGGASIYDSEGVTFYFGGNNPGKWIIDNGTDVHFSAPSNGDTAGMLFWQSADANCHTGYNGQNKFAGGAQFDFDGVIYAPNCGLVIDNNAQLGPSGEDAHMSVHAAWIEMKGNTRLTAYGADAEDSLVAETGFTSSSSSSTTTVVTTLIPELKYSN